MNHQLGFLIQLQALDVRRFQQETEQRQLPEQLKLAQEAVDREKEALAKSKMLMDLLSKEKKEKEQILQLIEEKITKLKGKSTELKTNKEYQAYLTELTGVRTEKGTIEEALLMVMEKVDLQRKEVAVQESRVIVEEKNAAEQNAEIAASLTQLKGLANALLKERETLVAQVDPVLLKEYSHLMVSRKGTAVVGMNANTCMGCNFSLPPQIVALVKMQEILQFCTYCRRIIYPIA